MAPTVSALAVQDVTSLRGGRIVLDGVSFSAAPGELLALMGVSGTGKTTVLRVIAGLDPIAAGCIEVDGIRITSNAMPRGELSRRLHRSVGMVFQFHHLFAHMSALQNVALAPIHVLRQPRVDAERAAMELLEQLGAADRAGALPHQLSGGEAQRVAIARALAVRPRILLMDEPTASLDQARRGELAETLKQVAAQGRTVLVATHDSDFVRACAQRAVLLDRGCVVRDGAVTAVLGSAP